MGSSQSAFRNGRHGSSQRVEGFGVGGSGGGVGTSSRSSKTRRLGGPLAADSSHQPLLPTASQPPAGRWVVASGDSQHEAQAARAAVEATRAFTRLRSKGIELRRNAPPGMRGSRNTREVATRRETILGRCVATSLLGFPTRCELGWAFASWERFWPPGNPPEVALASIEVARCFYSYPLAQIGNIFWK